MSVSAESRADRRYRQGLNAEPRTLAHMRRITAAHLRLWGYADLVESVALGLTEILTNVHRHSGSPSCVVTLQDIGAGVRLTVSDTSAQLPVARDIDWNAESGRGLHLIASVADSVGSDVTPTGKDVWAVFGTPGSLSGPGNLGNGTQPAA
jgi:anti-sigma regulatory factor (Ser/Thr protein kinase)